MNPSNELYQQRINKVIDYINSNLDKSFSLDELATVAHFSSYHFHRIFVAIVGESVNFYTNRVRLEKAARLLKFSKVSSVADIAFTCGFSSPSTFSRSFKDYFGLSPKSYKKDATLIDSKIRKELFPLSEYLVPMTIDEKQTKFPVEVKHFPKRKVAYIRVVNSYREGVVIDAFKRLIVWSKEMNLYDMGQFFGMSLDDPMTTPNEKYRYEACLEVPVDFESKESHPMDLMMMDECRYASCKVSGNINLVATATHYLFNEWLVNSSYEPEHQHGLELFLDKENICNWSSFDLDLCIPIKKSKTH